MVSRDVAESVMLSVSLDVMVAAALVLLYALAFVGLVRTYVALGDYLLRRRVVRRGLLSRPVE